MTGRHVSMRNFELMADLNDTWYHQPPDTDRSLPHWRGEDSYTGNLPDTLWALREQIKTRHWPNALP